MKTKQEYEKYLNEEGLDLPEKYFFIGGKMRKHYYPDRYGTALRKFDPIAFQASYDFDYHTTKIKAAIRKGKPFLVKNL